MKNWAARKAAQRAYPETKPCERCGSTSNVQRHHADLAKPLEIEFLCQECHVKADMQAGKWGCGPRKPKACKVCGREFMPTHSKNHNTCSRACLSEIGRRNAMKRWGGKGCTSPA